MTQSSLLGLVVTLAHAIASFCLRIVAHQHVHHRPEGALLRALAYASAACC